MELLQYPRDTIDDDAVLDRRRIAAVDVCSAADDHLGSLTERVVVGIAGIPQSIAGGARGKKVSRLGAIYCIRHHAVFGGIELGEISEKPPALAIRSMIGTRVGVVDVLGAPIRRSIGHSINAVEDIRPELLDISRAWKHAG